MGMTLRQPEVVAVRAFEDLSKTVARQTRQDSFWLGNLSRIGPS